MTGYFGLRNIPLATLGCATNAKKTHVMRCKNQEKQYMKGKNHMFYEN